MTLGPSDSGSPNLLGDPSASSNRVGGGGPLGLSRNAGLLCLWQGLLVLTATFFASLPIAAGLVVLGGLGTLLFHYYSQRPLMRFRKVAQEIISKNDFSQRVAFPATSDYRDIGDSFNRVVATSELAIQMIDSYSRNLERTVSTRTRQLRKTELELREMLQHIHHALLTFDRDFRINRNFSSQLRSMFPDGGVPAGKDVMQFLFEHSDMEAATRSELHRQLQEGFGRKEEGWKKQHGISGLSTTISVHGHSKAYRVDFHPLYDDKRRVHRFVAVVEDRTVHRRLLRDAVVRESEMAVLLDLARCGDGMFEVFCQDFRRRQQNCVEFISKIESQSVGEATVSIQELYAALQGMRYSAEVFGLQHLAGLVKGMERWLAEHAIDSGNATEVPSDLLSLELHQKLTEIEDTFSAYGSAQFEVFGRSAATDIGSEMGTRGALWAATLCLRALDSTDSTSECYPVLNELWNAVRTTAGMVRVGRLVETYEDWFRDRMLGMPVQPDFSVQVDLSTEQSAVPIAQLAELHGAMLPSLCSLYELAVNGRLAGNALISLQPGPNSGGEYLIAMPFREGLQGVEKQAVLRDLNKEVTGGVPSGLETKIVLNESEIQIRLDMSGKAEPAPGASSLQDQGMEHSVTNVLLLLDEPASAPNGLLPAGSDDLFTGSSGSKLTTFLPASTHEFLRAASSPDALSVVILDGDGIRDGDGYLGSEVMSAVITACQVIVVFLEDPLARVSGPALHRVLQNSALILRKPVDAESLQLALRLANRHIHQCSVTVRDVHEIAS